VNKLKPLAAAFLGAAALTAFAAPESYTIDPGHTFPSVEVVHFGTSIYRGKFTKSSGKVTLDKAAKTGSVDIAIDPASVDMGLQKLDDHIKSDSFLDVAKFPTATFKAATIKFSGDTPAEVPGELTLHGVTKPVTLTFNKFNCYANPMMKKDVCGGDLSATIKRSDFGIKFGIPNVSDDVKLQIQVEAIKDQ
jgi:polyisoprenoid-binding protein YceI